VEQEPSLHIRRTVRGRDSKRILQRSRVQCASQAWQSRPAPGVFPRVDDPGSPAQARAAERGAISLPQSNLEARGSGTPVAGVRRPTADGCDSLTHGSSWLRGSPVSEQVFPCPPRKLAAVDDRTSRQPSALIRSNLNGGCDRAAVRRFALPIARLIWKWRAARCSREWLPCSCCRPARQPSGREGRAASAAWTNPKQVLCISGVSLDQRSEDGLQHFCHE
jgi:hypothetical protein